MSLLTHSRMACAKTCLRRHYYAYERCIRKTESSQAIQVGSLFHRALEERAMGYPQNSITDEIYNEYFDETPEWVKDENDNKKWVSDGIKLIALIEGYFWQYGLAAEEGIEILGNEVEFKMDILNPETGGKARNFQMAGKIDKIVRLQDGRIAIMEHKTAGDVDDDYWKRLELDQQISLYVIAGRRLGFDIETVIYDVVQKPRHQLLKIPSVDDNGFKIVHADGGAGERVFLKNGNPRQAARKDENEVLVTSPETPSAFLARMRGIITDDLDNWFVRREIPRLESDISEMEQELWQQQKLLRECQTQEYWFRNTAACLHPFRCEYFDVCNQGFPVDGPLPSGYTQLTTPHPELKENHASTSAPKAEATAENGTK